MARRIMIIGAGPAGLAALKVLLETPQVKSGHWIVNSFEAREKVGGIWNPAEAVDDPPLTPLYDSLTTNIPHPVMAFTSHPFPPSTPIFPPAVTVQTYLEDYTSHFNLTPHIQFNTTVRDITWLNSRNLWSATLSTGQTVEKREYHTVIVANGHFRKPRYPDTLGLSEWRKAGRTSHSSWYRRPSDLALTVRKVVVVGNGPSGQDIVAELAEHGITVIHSVLVRSAVSDSDSIKKRGAILRFHPDLSTVIFKDGSVETHVDHCILATGYEMEFPFLSSKLLPSSSPGVFPNAWIPWNSSYHVFPLAKHIFPFPAESHFPVGSLAFMGLILRGTPLSLFEAQARAIAKVFAEPEVLDLEYEKQAILRRHQELGDGKQNTWHKLTEPEAFTYRDELYELAGLDLRVEVWEKEMWLYKVELRREWRALVTAKESDRWVEGIGLGGKQEWIGLLWRILERAGVAAKR
ncbi:flavin-containing monooxygenase [Moniliophthora roreri]|uniref:FAD/NAD(P)-binding domain-containing protein n=1 Tax=Moniliophthora roreri TaxID=221103 RepID=A0A0W0FNP0_MONRR|nr:flavin-containing monooxygenase [Moniliophthora roreri]